jgi:hypothetical protein
MFQRLYFYVFFFCIIFYWCLTWMIKKIWNNRFPANRRLYCCLHLILHIILLLLPSTILLLRPAPYTSRTEPTGGFGIILTLNTHLHDIGLHVYRFLKTQGKKNKFSNARKPTFQTRFSQKCTRWTCCLLDLDGRVARLYFSVTTACPKTIRKLQTYTSHIDVLGKAPLSGTTVRQYLTAFPGSGAGL